MIRAIYRDRCEHSLLCLLSFVAAPDSPKASTRVDSNSVYRNPASPDVLNTSNHPWDLSRPLLNPPPTDGTQVTTPSKYHTPYFAGSPPTSHTPSKSPTRARSHNDLLSLARERDERETGNQVAINDFNSQPSLPATGTNGGVTNRSSDNLDSQPVPRRQDQLSVFLPKISGGTAPDRPIVVSLLKVVSPDRRLSPWAHLDDLFEKLLFSVVSDDGNQLLSTASPWLTQFFP